ncbi:MAG TPA: cupin domain-containing protein [Spirochaetota bacterium]|nr:cupin domain-containing protein [Spirochaetota bacterium]HPJ34266.1 cupin domain-containing protein [Spirochaetota bacterium]
MKYTAVNFDSKFSKIEGYWQPKGIARLNNYAFKIARIKGEFIWHKHDDTDEVFIVNRGEVIVKLPDGEVKIGEGEMFVVPRGVEHKPVAEDECEIIMIEPEGTLNTGDKTDERTIDEIEWI